LGLITWICFRYSCRRFCLPLGDGQIKGEVSLGAGNDTFKNAGGTAGRVYGGDGNDTLIAGPHTDKFVFDTTLNAATNVDRVKHFDPGTDKLILDKTFFSALSGLRTLTSAEFHKGAHAHDTDHLQQEHRSAPLRLQRQRRGRRGAVRQARQGPQPPRQRLRRHRLMGRVCRAHPVRRRVLRCGVSVTTAYETRDRFGASPSLRAAMRSKS
jgi:hypothetical protein